MWISNGQGVLLAAFLALVPRSHYEHGLQTLLASSSARRPPRASRYRHSHWASILVPLFLHAYDSRSPHHDAAYERIEQMLSGAETVGLSWDRAASVYSPQHTSIHSQAATKASEAIELVQSWLNQPCD
jgi:hypothetical protein